MPELPEVETIRRELERDILNRRIGRVEVLATKTIHGKATDFVKQLTGNSITVINRRGKLLILDLKKGGYKLLIHLKMTGQLVYQDKKKLVFGGHNISEYDLVVPNRFTRVVFHFQPKAGKSALYFNDMRRFGFMKLVQNEAVPALVNKSYGLDALDPKFSAKYLAEVLKRRVKTSIKAALLDQKHLAGIGNIYADEACFGARILPNRRVSSLSSKEINDLYRAIKHVLQLAIKHGGTTFTSARSPRQSLWRSAGRSASAKAASHPLAGHFVHSDKGRGNFTEYLKVFDRKGKHCLRCLAMRDPARRDKIPTIQKTRLAGRGTHFCPECQR